MKALILDIETVGEEFSAIDPETQAQLTKRIAESATTPEEATQMRAQMEKELGLSPLTGEIVAIGILDAQTNLETVWYQPGTTNGGAPTETPAVSQEQSSHDSEPELPESSETTSFIACSEAEMLRAFWKKAQAYNTFVTFSGWQFDVPFLNIRSAIHRIKPSLNLMPNRFLNNQRSGIYHIDLQDQLSYYAAVKRKGSLHLWCRAFGIESPKVGGVVAEDVTALFRQGQSRQIAEYNLRDIRATKQLFDYWDAYLNLGR